MTGHVHLDDPLKRELQQQRPRVQAGKPGREPGVDDVQQQVAARLFAEAVQKLWFAHLGQVEVQVGRNRFNRKRDTEAVPEQARVPGVLG